MTLRAIFYIRHVEEKERDHNAATTPRVMSTCLKELETCKVDLNTSRDYINKLIEIHEYLGSRLIQEYEHIFFSNWITIPKDAVHIIVVHFWYRHVSDLPDTTSMKAMFLTCIQVLESTLGYIITLLSRSLSDIALTDTKMELEQFSVALVERFFTTACALILKSKIDPKEEYTIRYVGRVLEFMRATMPRITTIWENTVKENGVTGLMQPVRQIKRHVIRKKQYTDVVEVAEWVLAMVGGFLGIHINLDLPSVPEYIHDLPGLFKSIRSKSTRRTRSYDGL